MKQLYTVLALLALSFSASAEGYRSVAVNLKDGSKVEISLSDDFSAYFNDTDLIVDDGHQNITVQRGTIKSFTFSTKTGVESIDNDVTAPVISGGIMSFTNLPSATVVSVYDITGALLWQEHASGDYTVDLSKFHANVVIVKVNQVAYKIATIQ